MMNDIYMTVGKIVVTNIAVGLLAKGIEITNDKVKEFKQSRKFKEVKGKKPSKDKIIDVEYTWSYC